MLHQHAAAVGNGLVIRHGVLLDRSETTVAKGMVMIGTLFRVEVEPVKRQAFIDFIEEDIRVAKEREPGTLR